MFKFSQGVSKEVSWLVSTLGITVFIGWFIGHLNLAIFLYLAFYILRNLLSIRQFEKWFHEKNKSLIPPNSGYWEEISDLVARQNRLLDNQINQQRYRSSQFKEALMRQEDGIISIDVSGKIEWFNLAARKQLSLTGKDIKIHIELLLRVPKFIHYLRGGDFIEPLILPVLQGVPRTVSILVVRYYKDHKLIIIKDIHQLYNIAQIRKDFIANASHELRTPLTVINGYLEMMVDAQIDNGKWQKPLEQMDEQSKRMQSIISDLLTLSALESEHVSEELSTIDVPKLLKNQQEMVESTQQKNHKIIFEIDEKLLIQGYITPLTSVFSNLILNAIRYTADNGKILVKWYQSATHVVFEVEDSGIGIAPEHLARITERFYRVDAARSRESGGTGLGLSIVKYSLEMHKGSLIVESQYGKGSRFICEFPLELVIKDIATI